MAFKFLKDRPRGTHMAASTASTAYAVGEVVELTNNVFVALTPGHRAFGLVNTAKSASDTSTDPIEVTELRSDDVLVADIGTGTMADAYVDSNTEVDVLAGALTLDITASATDDCTIVGWDGKDTAKCYVTFNKTNF